MSKQGDAINEIEAAENNAEEAMRDHKPELESNDE
jgi:hypothetical protein